MTKVYLAGDMLKKGSQMLRALEREELNKIEGVHLYNPMDNKEINDKSKNPTAESIFAGDTQAILEAGVVIAEVDDNNVGTTCELGQVWGLNYMRSRIVEILVHSTSEHEVATRVAKLLGEIPNKKVYWQTTDIRDTNIPEAGHRRSHSLNQYLYGMMLDMSGEARKFEDIVEELQRGRVM